MVVCVLLFAINYVNQKYAEIFWQTAGLQVSKFIIKNSAQRTVF